MQFQADFGFMRGMERSLPSPTSVSAIAARLIQTREALGLTQTELCRSSGIERNTYNQWEKGRNRPDLDKAFLLCETFGLTLDWIYRGDPSGLPSRLNLALGPGARALSS